MRYWGKVAGGLIGLFAGMGPWGAILGVFLGHMLVDRQRQRSAGWDDAGQRQTLIFTTTFEVMGHLAKSKGRVTQADIHNVNLLMDRMGLYGETRLAAQNAFRAGKSPHYPLRDKLHQLRRACIGRVDLIQMFLEIQIEAALADGNLHAAEQDVLYVISEALGISRQQFTWYLQSQRFHAGRRYQYSDQNSTNETFTNEMSTDDTLNAAYQVLGVTPDQDATTIKRAYRKLMLEHHPDKLVAKGLPPSMMQLARQKAQKIQRAYDVIKLAKGFK